MSAVTTNSEAGTRPSHLVATDDLADAQGGTSVDLGLLIRTLTPPPAPWGFFTVKRAFDIVLASILLVLGVPVYLLIALAIKLDSPGPIFFEHERVRQGLRRFWVLKFRTMYAEARPFPLAIYDVELQAYRRPRLSEDARVTRVGRMLRRFSVDELPQVWNILKGEMSFIGPRPLSVPESLLVPVDALVRYSVPSGITGVAQLKQRNAIVCARFAGDIEYVGRLSYRQEISLFFATFSKLHDKTI